MKKNKSRHDGSRTVKFRINMDRGFAGADVALWQKFLIVNGYGLNHDNTDHVVGDTSHPYPNGKFDDETIEATMRFQGTPLLNPDGTLKYALIAVTGQVNWATYFKAELVGMPASKAVAPNSKAQKWPPRGIKVVGDDFRVPLKMGYSDAQTDTHVTPNKLYNDVADWQQFLVNNGYLGSGYPTGTFGTTTQTATAQFQHDASVTGDTSGQVGQHTFTTAENSTWGMDKYKQVTYPLRPRKHPVKPRADR